MNLKIRPCLRRTHGHPQAIEPCPAARLTGTGGQCCNGLNTAQVGEAKVGIFARNCSFYSPHQSPVPTGSRQLERQRVAQHGRRRGQCAVAGGQRVTVTEGQREGAGRLAAGEAGSGGARGGAHGSLLLCFRVSEREPAGVRGTAARHCREASTADACRVRYNAGALNALQLRTCGLWVEVRVHGRTCKHP